MKVTVSTIGNLYFNQRSPLCPEMTDIRYESTTEQSRIIFSTSFYIKAFDISRWLVASVLYIKVTRSEVIDVQLFRRSRQYVSQETRQNRLFKLLWHLHEAMQVNWRKHTYSAWFQVLYLIYSILQSKRCRVFLYEVIYIYIYGYCIKVLLSILLT